MKKIQFCITLCLFIIACNNPQKQEEPKPADHTPPVATAVPEAKETFPLMAKYDCETCHRTDEKLTGPSYNEIAQKYAGQANAVELLSSKIIDGGSGVWGSIPMNAHPGMQKEDAQQLVEYILAMKK